jgi:splicing suppressor protein 51
MPDPIEEEQPPTTVPCNLSLESQANDDNSSPYGQFGPYDMYKDERICALRRYYEDSIATNNPNLNIEDYVGKYKGPESSQQEDTSQEGLIDLDEATNITPRRIPLVSSDTTVAQAFFVSGLKYTSYDAIATYDNIAYLIESLQSDPPSPHLTILTHNVDTNEFRKWLKTKPAAYSAFEVDSPEEIAPYSACARCQHNPINNSLGLTLLTCEKCKSVEYCSLSCQDADWSAHQIMYCVNPGRIPLEQLAEPHLPSFLKTCLPNPFARLSKGLWLHDRHKVDVYALLIDSFRLRESDDYWYAGLKKKESTYNGKENSGSPFRLFLDLAETRGLMPPWWSRKKRVECLDMGLDQSSDNFHDLCAMTRDIEILVIYESAIMLMQLRMFAESV